MSIKVVLFDLDGTLLPLDQETFTKTYFGLLAQNLAPHGYEPQSLIQGIWAGTVAMVKNTGEKTNEEVFWDKFASIFGEESRNDLPYFDKFYQQDFDKVKISCGFNSEVKNAVKTIKNMGFRTALATNPIFPAIATEKRIKWAGLAPEDFEFYTTYENAHFCKPNPKYYQEILKSLDVTPEQCLMVGNDVTEDMIASTLGINVFLVTDCLINRENKDISTYPHGNFPDLLDFVKTLR
ncbi:MAG: HAD family hydrolase [Clostridia bacterium]|nr:HAD family hydrolase [Clostridia bacterium]